MRQKLTGGYILIHLLLIFLLSILNSSIYINREESFNTISLDYLIITISAMVIVGLILNGFLVKILIQFVENEAKINTQAAYYESVNDLFQTIKSQRHDFNNHVQVVYGMITENLIDAAKEYISNVYKETKQINEIIIVDRPELAALFQAKYGKAAINHIKLNIKVNCKLIKLDVKPHDLVRIVGNLIDNAIEATALLDVPDKEVSMIINKQDKDMFIEIINPGNILEDAHFIFRPGASMKEGHSGLGLYIVKKIVESYNGEIKFTNNNGKVKFVIRLPHK